MNNCLVFLAALLLPLAALAGEPSEHDAPQPDPIVNGELEPDFPAVVALGADFGGGPFSACTGTLITPRVVLTAAHCGGGLPVNLIVAVGRVFIGPNVDDVDQDYGFIDYQAHPDYEELSNGPNGTLGANDVGVGVLDGAADVEPMWLNLRELGSGDVDAELLSVGFGTTGSDGAGGGVKRSAVVTIDGFDEQFIISANSTNPNDANICSGDSGGPQLFEVEDGRWEVWGVHSWGDEFCTQRSGSTRVDLMQEWILDRVEEVHDTRDLCEANGRYGDGVCDAFCEVEDPDCVIDEGDDDDSAVGGGTGCEGGCSASGAGGSAGLLALLLLPLLRRRRTGGPLLGIAAAALMLLPTVALAAKPTLPELSEDERARIVAGTIVLKKTVEGEGSSLVNAIVELGAEPAELWPILFSVEHMRASSKSIKSLEATRDVMAGADRFLDLTYVLKVGWSEIRYSVNRHYTASDDTMRWTLDKTKEADIEWTEGSYSCYPGSAPGRTLFLYRARIVTGKAIPAWLEEDLTESSLKKYLKYLKQTAEE